MKTPNDEEWQPNTPENPFWKSKEPVEIKMRGGETRILKCPGCGRRMMPLVEEWRKAFE